MKTLTADQLASICHAANMELNGILGEPTWGWYKATEEMKSATITGVVAILNDPTMTPANSHELWCRSKREQGWTHGPARSTENKEHPCLVPYDQLPEEQRIKDHLFFNIVRALAPMYSIEAEDDDLSHKRRQEG